MIAPRFSCNVYGLFREDGTPFYAGKGGPRMPYSERWLDHRRFARNGQPGYLYDYIREIEERGVFRERIIYGGLTNAFALDVEKALIANQEFGQGRLLNRKGGIPSPKARAYIARRRQLWRLPAIVRIRVSLAARDVALQTLNGLMRWRPSPQGGFYLWLEKPVADKLAAVMEPGEGYSGAILWLAKMKAAA